MNVLVTGGLGYIGSHTVLALLEAGHQVAIIDNLSNSEYTVLERLQKLSGKKIAFYQIDVLHQAALQEVFEQEKQLNGIIHFAAKKSVPQSVAQPSYYYEQNIGGLINLLKMVEKYEIPQLVFSSSCRIYGEPEAIPIKEDTPRNQPLTPYGHTKLIAESLLEEFARLKPFVSIALLRYFNPVGAHPSAQIGELPRGVPGNLMPYITQVAAGWREELTIYGNDYGTPDKTAVRDFIHVVDLADAHLRAFEWLETQKGGAEAFNIGTGKGYSVLEVVKSFEQISKLQLPYRFAERRLGDIEKIWADPTKAREILHWEAKYDLDDMTRSSWNWQQQLESKP